MAENDFDDDELIQIELPRKEYNTLKKMIEREVAYNWFISKLKNNSIFVIGGGIVTLFLLYDRLVPYLQGTIK